MNLDPTIICEFGLFFLSFFLFFVLKGTNVIYFNALNQLVVGQKVCESGPARTVETCLDWPGSTGAPSASIPQPFGPNKDGKHSSYAVKHRAPRAAGVLGPKQQTRPFCCESAASWPRSDMHG